MVLVAKRDKKRVYEHLLNEGVIVIKKDLTLPQHKETGVPNLHVWMILKSLKSRDFVELVFNWRHYYYFLKNNGVEFLRKELGIVEEVVPVTHKKTTKNYRGAEEGEEEGRPKGRGRPRGERGERGDRRPGPYRSRYGRGRDKEGEEQGEGQEQQATEQPKEEGGADQE